MRIRARKISHRIYGRVAELKNRLARARYFHGHGVHSPFIYDIVRRVFMCNSLMPGERRLFDSLMAAGIVERRAVQLQNLCIHCHYKTFGFNHTDVELCIATRQLSRRELLALVRTAAITGTTVAVMEPYDGRERQALCLQIVDSHPSTTVDNRGYLLIFNNHLPKQHFRI